MATGYLLHEGPSPFDGRSSRLRRCTPAAQNRRHGADLTPGSASVGCREDEAEQLYLQLPAQFGRKRTCYVGQAPTDLAHLQSVGYADQLTRKRCRAESCALVLWRSAFMPITVVANLLMFAKGHTGYTRSGSRSLLPTTRASSWRQWVRRSKKRWRRARAGRHSGSCPAGNRKLKTCLAAPDNRVQCERCLLCNGKKANIGIHAHGRAAKQVEYLA